MSGLCGFPVSCGAAGVAAVPPGLQLRSVGRAVSWSHTPLRFKVLSELIPTNSLCPCVAAAEKQMTPFQRVICRVRLNDK